MEKKIPDILRKADGSPIASREEWERERPRIKEIVCREEYGFLPLPPDSVEAQASEPYDGFCAGKARMQTVKLQVRVGRKSFTFPVSAVVPKTETPPMAFVLISFGGPLASLASPPIEEIVVDHGFAVFTLNYDDVTRDDNDFTDGICQLFPETASRYTDPSACGKLGLWAWAMSRVMDYLQTRNDIDKNNIAAVGHSRLGKTALLAAAMDERFAFAVPVNSGCSGAAIFRGKVGEDIDHIADMFPFWFCGNFQKYRNKEDELPFDQHFLTGLIAPRKLYVCSALEDQWADPAAELLGCRLASPVYELYGEQGLVCPEKAELEVPYQEGSVGYHIRKGTHYFSRYDWLKIMDFMDKHRN